MDGGRETAYRDRVELYRRAANQQPQDHDKVSSLHKLGSASAMPRRLLLPPLAHW
jgi:hypothetical protein